MGVEPIRCHHQRILSPSRLPIPTHRLICCLYSILQACQKIKIYFALIFTPQIRSKSILGIPRIIGLSFFSAVFSLITPVFFQAIGAAKVSVAISVMREIICLIPIFWLLSRLGLSGPVGIVNAVNEAVKYGWRDVLSLAAVITVNLGVFNLLPIPGLDGCKLLFLAAEGITRRELPLRFQTAINAAGMILLLMLVVLTTMQDVAKYIL